VLAIHRGSQTARTELAFGSETAVPYFFILPAFLVMECALLATLIATYVTGGVRPYRPHVIRILVWTTVGFMLANGVLWLCTWGILRVAPRDGQPAVGATRVLLVILMLPGPFVASLLGVGIGAVVGLRQAFTADPRGGRTRG
jgi:hypothetical protein